METRVPETGRVLGLRPGAAITALLFLPPALVAAGGGADIDLAAGWRVSWFEPVVSALGVATAALLALLAGRRRRVARVLELGATALLTIGAIVLWSGGVQNEWLSLSKPGRPTLAAGALLALALVLERHHLAWPAWRAVGALVVLCAVGAGLAGAAVSRDAALLGARLAAGTDAPPAGERATDVIVILADTLRADALGLYGAKPSRSPFLDGLAEQARVFERAYAQAPWTVPSVASLFSSLHPSTVDPEDGEILRTCGFAHFRLPDVPTLASTLSAAGYKTVGLQKNPLLRPGTGFERGFASYETVGGDRAEDHAARHMADAVIRTARVLARARAGGDARPFLLYAHFMDPHIDYRPPRAHQPPQPDGLETDGSARSVHAAIRRDGGPTPQEVDHWRALYAGEVAYLDQELERMAQALGELGLWSDETLVVFVADHGEQFGEHGRYEHCDLYTENVRVPLFFRGAGVVPGRSARPVGLLDVTPTLLDWLDLPPLANPEGRSRASLLRGEDREGPPVVTEHKRGWRVSTDRHALVVDKRGVQLFDLVADPLETRDLAAERPEAVASLQAVVERHQARTRPAVDSGEPAPVLDAETREALRALGYAE